MTEPQLELDSCFRLLRPVGSRDRFPAVWRLECRAVVHAGGRVACAACSSSGIPSPNATLNAYADAARKRDSKAILRADVRAQSANDGREGVERAVSDARTELAEQAAAATSPGARIEASAKVNGDGEIATLELEDGVAGVVRRWASCWCEDPGPSPRSTSRGARSPKLRGAHACFRKKPVVRWSAIFARLSMAFERPEGLDVKVVGDKATVQDRRWASREAQAREWPVAYRGFRLMSRLNRRSAMLAMLGASSSWIANERDAHAFGEEGAFHSANLADGHFQVGGLSSSLWPCSMELRACASYERLSKSNPATIRADSGGLLAEPFVVWTGDGPIAALSSKEIDMLRKFITSGGTMLVDDAAPETGAFGRRSPRACARAALIRSSRRCQIPGVHFFTRSTD
ncbi:MAG: DUF4159 domain-containing protein [Polyangiaceae bacterium]